MPDEPDNLILTMLRDIRAKLDEHTKRFDELKKQIEDWQETTATGVGFAVHANLPTQAIEERIADLG